MELKYILEFVELVDAGKFSEAAERMFLSQSSLSKHMKALEADLGVPLFERETKRKVILSEHGKLYLPYAEQIAILHREYLALQAKHIKALSSTLKIGSIPSMEPYRITDLLTGFQNAHPDLALKVEEVESAVSCERIRQGKLDCAFVREYPGMKDSNLERINYTFDTLCAVLNQNHPLAKEKKVSLLQLCDESFLLLKDSSFMYEMCVEACEKAGFIPNVTYTGSRGDNIVNMVSRGSGVALLTKRPIVHFKTQNVAVVDITPSISTEINLLYSKERQQSEILTQFIEYMKSNS